VQRCTSHFSFASRGNDFTFRFVARQNGIAVKTFALLLVNSYSYLSTCLTSKKGLLCRPALRIAAALSLLIAGSGSVFSQNDTSLPGSSFEISGQIRSPDGRKTIEFVSVRLERAGGSLVDQRMTDSMGRFRFSRLNPGQYVVSAKSPGFNVSPQTVDLNRFIPRAFLLLQLVPETSLFASKNAGRSAVINANIPEKARKEMDKAQVALAQKKTDEGILYLEKAVSLFPEFLDAHMLLGSTYMELGNLVKAEAAFGMALKTDPKSVDARVSLGEVHRRQKNYPKAEQFLLEALKQDEEAWVAHYTLARVYWETNEIIKTGRQIGRTIQLNPQFAEAHLLGGNVFMKIGMPENALVEYEEYLRLAPNGQPVASTKDLVQKIRRSLPNKKQ
jgi:tetratricopeptide (TPR) repeat protein